jgi:hypothetical protein
MLRLHQEQLRRLERRRALRRERAPTISEPPPTPLSCTTEQSASATPSETKVVAVVDEPSAAKPEPEPEPEPQVAAEPTVPVVTEEQQQETDEQPSITDGTAEPLRVESPVASKQPSVGSEISLYDTLLPASLENLDAQELAAMFREYDGDEIVVDVPEDVASNIDNMFAKLQSGMHTLTTLMRFARWHH